MSGPVLARLAGVSQPTVSRIENGRAVAAADVVVHVVDALGVTGTARMDLDRLITDAYAETGRRVDAGVSMRRGGSAELTDGAAVVRCFQSATVPGLLQTEDYAAAVRAASPASTDDDGGTERTVLDDLAKQFTFLVTEGALRTWPNSPGSMPTQLARLAEADERANVRVGVVPWSTSVPVVPLHGFTVYDDRAVLVETFTRELTFTDPADVAAHRGFFDAFAATAVFGGDMRQILDMITDNYRELDKKHTPH